MYNYPTRNFGLDVIRAIAILLVVISHCTYILPEFNPILTDGIRLLGATGVDIFFVLSGYLIGGILIKKLNSRERSFKELFHFWKRRWFRTLPNYFVVLLLNIILLQLLDKTIVENIWLYIPFIQNFTTPHPNFFTEAWSLSIEEYAYLILPLIIYSALFVFKKVSPSKVFIATTVLSIIILFWFKIQFYYCAEIVSYESWSSQFRKVVLYRLDAIYYGFILIYLMTKYTFFKKRKQALALTGLLSFIILHLLIVLLDIMPERFELFFSIFYLPFISLSIALVFPWFVDLKTSKSILGIVTYISTRSYSIYLVNYSLVLLTLQHYFSISLITVVVYLVVTIIASELLYQLVEQPFLKLRQRLVPRK